MIQFAPTVVGANSPRNVIEVKEEQDWNALFPMDVMLMGMVTEVKEALELNALSPTATTGYLPNLEGMVIDPPAPVDPVMVAFPPQTV